MIRTSRKIVTVDGVKYIVIKLAQSLGPKDRLLVIGPDGQNRLIDIKHMEYLDAKAHNVTIQVED